jgi:Asp-tRNA(Asn)/Glu-tRNA(Gln) amidotransferase A subunit family amidase
MGDVTIAELQAAMASGEASALSITRARLRRIERMDWAGPQLNFGSPEKRFGPLGVRQPALLTP